MNLVRIILILIGIILLVGIGWWERRRRQSPNQHDTELLEGIGVEIRSEEGDGSLDFSGLDGITASDEASLDVHHGHHIVIDESSSSSPLQAKARPMVEEKLLVIHLVAPENYPYSGHDLLTALQDARLVYGEMNIFHHYVKGHRRPVFSMANMFEPGTFHPEAMNDFLTPGLTFFMHLPGQVKGPQALESMLKSALHLATELGGNLCDQSRRPLDKQEIAKLHDEVLEYQRRIDNST